MEEPATTTEIILTPETSSLLLMEILNPELPTATTTCNYFNPKNASGNLPSGNQPFQFASSTCYIQVPVNFMYASGTLPTMSYGDVLISFFLFLLILGSVFSFIVAKLLDKRPVGK